MKRYLLILTFAIVAMGTAWAQCGCGCERYDCVCGKSLTLTEEGRRHALELLDAYDIKLDPDPAEQRFFRLQVQPCLV